MRAMAHRVIVMKAGRVVEEGDTLDVLHAPSHPPRALLASSMLAPDPEPESERREGDAND
jgi:microcin C transport system ATP-binding protein